jgi:hypothetical protein
MPTLRGRAAWAHDFNPDRSVLATFQAPPGARSWSTARRRRPTGMMLTQRLICLMLLLLSGSAYSGDLVEQPASSTGTRWKSMEHGSVGSTRPKAISFAGGRLACSIGAARKPRML